MQRQLELRLHYEGTTSKLTITPDRITVKVRTADAEMANTWFEAAKAIAERVDFDRSLRGRLEAGRSTVWLKTDNKSSSPKYQVFLYDFHGKLMGKTALMGRTAEPWTT
jgi:hypothetical protein